VTAHRPGATLYLIPSNLAAGDPTRVLAASALAVAGTLDHFIAERAKSARAFLKAIGHPRLLREITIEELNEHTPEHRIPALLAPLRAGVSCGLLAEAGCPAVADPGAPLVLLAHQAGVRVKPLVGPSAIILALMASGLQGQRFAFHGYLSATKGDREEQLRTLEAVSRSRDETQIFIETPYRNLQLFGSLLACCAPDTLLCVASDLTGPAERVSTRSVADWRRGDLPAIGKLPSVFLLHAHGKSVHRGG
jgi:16S rRNA (cytidine1402-2'-O)-methyltransferase